jgi:hypothetical protein
MKSGPVGRLAEELDLPADPEEFSRECFRRRWTDGLPVIPPTRTRVDRMLSAAGRDPVEIVGVLAPRRGIATVESVAVSAVLAGCEPRQFEAVLAAVQATAAPVFNLDAVNATTHPVGMFVLLSPAAAAAAGVQGGAGCFGPGFPANLAIGRALRFVQLATAGAWPGDGDRSEQASPAKLAFCAAEQTDASPWPHWHTTRGLDADAHAVTVFACEGPHNIQDHTSATAEGLLLTVTGAMSQPGSNNIAAQGHPLLALGPEHAALLHTGGFGRADIQRFIYEQARFPAHRLSIEYVAARTLVDGQLLIADSPDTIAVMVLGGPGKHSAWMPTFGRATAPSTVSWKPAANQPGAR